MTRPFILQVALVGAPNVGKSSLVQLLSSGLPEVQNYPFTTRSIKMGHFYVDGRRHQVHHLILLSSTLLSQVCPVFHTCGACIIVAQHAPEG